MTSPKGGPEPRQPIFEQTNPSLTFAPGSIGLTMRQSTKAGAPVDMKSSRKFVLPLKASVLFFCSWAATRRPSCRARFQSAISYARSFLGSSVWLVVGLAVCGGQLDDDDFFGYLYFLELRTALGNQKEKSTNIKKQQLFLLANNNSFWSRGMARWCDQQHKIRRLTVGFTLYKLKLPHLLATSSVVALQWSGR